MNTPTPLDLYDKLMALRLAAAEFADEAADNSTGSTSTFEARERGRASAFAEAAALVKTFVDARQPLADSAVLQDDLRELLTVLGIGDYARAESPHEVFQEALTELRTLLASAEVKAISRARPESRNG